MKPTPVTSALRGFAGALQVMGIDPRQVEVSLPLDEWQALARALDEERAHTDEPDSEIGRIQVAGVRYLVRFGE